MQLPRIGRKWLARPGIYLAGAALIATLAAAACGGDKSALTPTPDYEKPAATATATPYPTDTSEPPKATAESTKEYKPLVDVDGRYDPEEWKDAKSIDIQGGKLLYKNDNRFLYLLLDVTSDTGDDPPVGDAFQLEFDVNNDQKGTPMIDRGYSLFRPNVPLNPENKPKLGTYVLLTGPPESSYLGWSAIGLTSSELGVGFGETGNSNTPHRYWELKIDLGELGIEPTPGSSYELGLREQLASKIPQFHVGQFQQSFENLPRLQLKF